MPRSLSNIAPMDIFDSAFHLQFDSAFHLLGKIPSRRIPTRLPVAWSDLLVANGPRYAGGLEIEFLFLELQNDLTGFKSFLISVTS